MSHLFRIVLSTLIERLSQYAVLSVEENHAGENSEQHATEKSDKDTDGDTGPENHAETPYR